MLLFTGYITNEDVISHMRHMKNAASDINKPIQETSTNATTNSSVVQDTNNSRPSKRGSSFGDVVIAAKNIRPSNQPASLGNFSEEDEDDHDRDVEAQVQTNKPLFASIQTRRPTFATTNSNSGLPSNQPASLGNFSEEDEDDHDRNVEAQVQTKKPLFASIQTRRPTFATTNSNSVSTDAANSLDEVSSTENPMIQLKAPVASSNAFDRNSIGSSSRKLFGIIESDDTYGQDL
jgi:hypothetical protein